jgi:hypothetical protein
MVRSALIRAAACAALALAGAAPLAGQTTPLQMGAISLSGGGGSGTASITCDGCASQSASNASYMGALGVAVRRDARVIVESSGWQKNFDNASGSSKNQLIVIDAAYQWYPARGYGFFIQAGGGVVYFNSTIYPAAAGTTTVSSVGGAFTAGAGWDVPVIDHFALTPYVGYAMGSKAAATINGASSTLKVGGSLLHFGLAVSWR